MKMQNSETLLGKQLYVMAFLFLVFLFSFTQLNAQSLKTDFNVPDLNACGSSQQFSVSVVKGNLNCNNGNLKIEVPIGFELESGSVRLNGQILQLNVVVGQPVNIPILFGEGPVTEEARVDFNVKALCDAIGNLDSDKKINYSFEGCNKKIEDTSESISILYAVLRVNVASENILGRVNQQIDRKIEIINQGNGSISEFTLERNLGDGLTNQALAYDVQNITSQGWTVDFSDPNLVKFSGVELNTGEKISIIEKILVDNCILTPTEYQVYYGCTEKCVIDDKELITTAIISLDINKSPKLEVISNKPILTCFNTFIKNSWTIKNTGTASTEMITFNIQSKNELNIANGTVKVNGESVNVLIGSTINNAIINIPFLAIGESIDVEFEQKYEAPNDSTANCQTAPEVFSTGQNAYSASYNYEGACDLVTVEGNVNEATTYVFAGQHIGEVDIFSGTDFIVDYLFHDFSIPSDQLTIGDHFAITIEVSNGLSLSTFDFNGVTVTPLGGNKYELVFVYGTNPWNVGKALDYAFSRLSFPVQLDCAIADLKDLWYQIGGELRKQSGSCESVVFKCNVTNLKGFCGNGPCDNGLINDKAYLKRTNVGFEVDQNGKPVLGTTSTRAELRNFIAGDILEISQDSRVKLTSESFTKLKFVVKKDVTGSNVTLVPNSGKVTIDGIVVKSDAFVKDETDSYTLEYILVEPLIDGQNVNLSLSLKAGSSTLGLKQFPVNSYLITANGQELSCGRPYTATGLYVPTTFDFYDGSVDFIECINDTNEVVFKARIANSSAQDSFFKNEFRSIFTPTSITINIPKHLTMTGIKIEIRNQKWLGENKSFTIHGLNYTNSTYNLDLSEALKKITEKTLGVNNGISYLDEGFELAISPVVSLNACEPISDKLSESLIADFEGIIVDETNTGNSFTKSKKLEYFTGFGTLQIKTSSNSSIGKFSADGKEVSWIIEVASAGSRNFNSVWLAKKSGVLTIKSVQQVVSYTNETILGTIAPTNKIYRLGDIDPNTPKYYLIKADVLQCSEEQLILAAGYNCTTNSYPTAIADATCTINEVILEHKRIANELQVEIKEAFNGFPNIKPNLCEPIWYEVQLHNAGDSKLNTLKVIIPLDSAPGLVFQKFEIGDVYYATNQVPTSYRLGTTSTVTDNVLSLEIPNDYAISTLERIRVRVYFTIDSCDFMSGSKHTVRAEGNNICDEIVKTKTNPSTKRLIIQGGSDAFPELRLVSGASKLVIEPVLAGNESLRASYSTSIINSGEFDVKDAITTDYKVALKLPQNWSIVGDPADYVSPSSKLVYQGLDAERGYIYNVTSNITVGEKVSFNNVPLKYTLGNEISLDCNVNFGDIQVLIFQNIEVTPCGTTPDCSVKGIDQVLYKETVSMILPLDEGLSIIPESQIVNVCNPTISGGFPTLADIILDQQTKVYHLDWYENELEATTDLPVNRLSSTTPLVNGRTYYLINRFIYNGACKSNIGKIKVQFTNNCCDLIVEAPKQITVNCGSSLDPLVTGYPEVIQSCWSTKVVYSDSTVSSCQNKEKSFTRTFTITDEEGNIQKVQQIIKIKDEVAPVFNSVLPINITVSCASEVPAPALLTAVDNCGIATVAYIDVIIEESCANNFVVERTYTATDACGNTAKHVQFITVKDDVAPIFNGILPADIAVSCASAVPAPAKLTATDNCEKTVIIVTSNDVIIEESCANNYTIERTYTAVDACGNTATHVQFITVKDDIVPLFNGSLPKNITVSCEAHVPAPAVLTATDNCGSTIITATSNDVIIEESCANNFVVERTYTATDACGNTAKHVQVITVKDDMAPLFNGSLPKNITVSCEAHVPAPAVLTATDNCGSTIITATSNDIIIEGSCANNYTIERTYTATDACGNTAKHVQVITVKDDIAPVFNGSLPKNITVSCEAHVPAPAVLTATDNCGSTIITVTSNDVIIEGSCANNYTIERTYTATDVCGNTVTHKQIITVKDDIAPVFNETLPANITVSCKSEVPAPAVLTATDNCGSTLITATSKDVIAFESCASNAIIERTYTATDVCGNTVKYTQIITIKNDIAPIFTSSLPVNITVSCAAEVPSPILLSASDYCSSTLITATSKDVIIGDACSYVIERTYTAKDLCGNTATHVQLITVKDDVVPVFNNVLPANITVSCSAEVPVPAILSATDNCSKVNVTSNDVIIEGSCTNNYVIERTYTAKDLCGNTATHVQLITVKDDVAPVFNNSLPANITVSCKLEIPVATKVTATDNCGKTIITAVPNDVIIGGSCDNNYTIERTYTATDACGNTATHVQIITIKDEVSPVFKSILPKNVTVSCEANIPTPTVLTAIDNCGSLEITATSNDVIIKGSCANSYVIERTYTATDACGNKATHVQVITVKDDIAPVFNETLPANITVSCLAEVPAPAVLTATDNCGSTLITAVVNDIITGGSCDNNYVIKRTYTAADACGNAITYTQTIIVEDKTAPTFVTVPQNLVVECDGAGNLNEFKAWLDKYTASNVAVDNCSDEVKMTYYIEDTNTICGYAGNIVVSFFATDKCGNVAMKQAVFIIRDTIAPIFIQPAKSITVECGDKQDALNAWLATNGGAIAEDLCSADVTWTNNFTDFSATCGNTGFAKVTFTATDACGNQSSTTATFTVVDTTKPYFQSNLPQNLVLECNEEIPAPALIKASDSCSTVEVTFNETRVDGYCVGAYKLIRTWTATDECGNQNSHVQTITIQDTTKPQFIGVLPHKDIYMNCKDLKDAEILDAIDNCGEVTVTSYDEEILSGCVAKYTIVRTWIATDSCGNETTYKQNIHLSCDINVFNGVSPNGDGDNDEFIIEGLNCYPGNTVEIYNRWGVLVYETTNYNSNGNTFKGYSGGRSTISRDAQLPTGTYFYVIKYTYDLGNGQTSPVVNSGYLHLETN